MFFHLCLTNFICNVWIKFNPYKCNSMTKWRCSWFRTLCIAKNGDSQNPPPPQKKKNLPSYLAQKVHKFTKNMCVLIRVCFPIFHDVQLRFYSIVFVNEWWTHFEHSCPRYFNPQFCVLQSFPQTNPIHPNLVHACIQSLHVHSWKISQTTTTISWHSL
jgi:hypothetical protein